MKNLVRLHIGGDYACFTRTEIKAERVSYDVLTPYAARGILEAIHWKPAIFWAIDKIHVLKPIRSELISYPESVNRTESTELTNQNSLNFKSANNINTEHRSQKTSRVLKDVSYIIEAHIKLTEKAGKDDNLKKHLEIFKRRAIKGQYFQQPCLGTRKFPAWFTWIDENSELLISNLPEHEANRDLGLMLHDIDFANNATPYFYHAKLQNGIINVPPFRPSDKSV